MAYLVRFIKEEKAVANGPLSRPLVYILTEFRFSLTVDRCSGALVDKGAISMHL